MKDKVRERTLRIAHYMITHRCTVRDLEEVFPEYCRSTYHKDLVNNLPKINPALSSLVSMLMRHNARVASSNGGKKSPGEGKVRPSRGTK